MQLRPVIAAVALVVVALSASHAVADGVVTTRGVYYKERSTRVVQPMIDVALDVGESGALTAHTLVDSISSASVASGATSVTFDETRLEYGANYLHRFGLLRVGGGGRYSSEPDYKSIFGSLRGDIELFQRNTTVGMTFAAGHDRISNAGAQGGLSEPVEGELDTVLGSISLGQLVSPHVVVGLTYDLIYLDGYQENPYRSVAAGGSLEPERVPDTRARHALFGSARTFVPASSTTVVLGYRLYADDWGIVGHTPGIRVIQEIVSGLDLHLRYRYHRQSAADFYKDIYDTADPSMEPYITDDDKLGALSSQTFGAKVSSALSVLGLTGHAGRVRALVGLEYITQTTHYGNAINAQLAIAVPIDY